MASKPEYYNTGGGELFFTPIVNGVIGTEVPFGQTENIAFQTEVEELAHDNTEGCVVYEDLKILKKITGTLNIETLEISPDMLTRAFLATDATVTVPSGSVSGEEVVLGALDKAYPVSKRFISNVVVKDDSDATTYVEGTDYTYDSDKGTVTPLSTGAITANDTVHVSFDNAEYLDIRIEAFTQTKIEGKLRFVSCAGAGLSYTYTFHRVSLLSSGEFSLKNATEFAKLAFTGTMLADDTIQGTGLSKLFKIEGVKKVA
jgi:hypothetical protein